MRGLAVVILVGLLAAAVTVFTRDPEDGWPIAIVIVALAASTGALAALLLGRPRARGRRAAGPRRAVALRRGLEIAVVVGLLLWLRVVDGLSVITGSFVIGTFVVAEAVLSARPASSR
jgi:cobalamin synthase